MRCVVLEVKIEHKGKTDEKEGEKDGITCLQLWLKRQLHIYSKRRSTIHAIHIS